MLARRPQCSAAWDAGMLLQTCPGSGDSVRASLCWDEKGDADNIDKRGSCRISSQERLTCSDFFRNCMQTAFVVLTDDFAVLLCASDQGLSLLKKASRGGEASLARRSWGLAFLTPNPETPGCQQPRRRVATTRRTSPLVPRQSRRGRRGPDVARPRAPRHRAPAASPLARSEAQPGPERLPGIWGRSQKSVCSQPAGEVR